MNDKLIYVHLYYLELKCHSRKMKMHPVFPLCVLAQDGVLPALPSFSQAGFPWSCSLGS